MGSSQWIRKYRRFAGHAVALLVVLFVGSLWLWGLRDAIPRPEVAADHDDGLSEEVGVFLQLSDTVGVGISGEEAYWVVRYMVGFEYKEAVAHTREERAEILLHLDAVSMAGRQARLRR